MVTSNHIHLLVLDEGTDHVIAKSIQLIAGHTGQEFNLRKNRRVAFWEDRYHATAIANDKHLTDCQVYINMNMVRAGVVSHPAEWDESGFVEMIKTKQRYSILDQTCILKLFNLRTFEEYQQLNKQLIKNALEKNQTVRESKWTESIAVGDLQFVKDIQTQLTYKVKCRKVTEIDRSYILHEPLFSYNADFDSKNDALSPKNAYFWDINY